MVLNILTRCTRPNNLEIIKKNIFNDLFNIKWFILFDTSVIRDIDAKLLLSLSNDNIVVKYFDGVPGDYGNNMLNHCIDIIEDGFIYVLDDDNIIHEDFYKTIYKSIIENPEKQAFIFNQKIGYKDFTKQDIRIAAPENMEVGCVDMAQFLLHRNLIQETRFELMSYIADGIFIKELFVNNFDKFIFISNVLCYYNFLENNNNSLPRILIIGSDEFDLHSFYYNDYESTELNTKFITNDNEIDYVISKFDPDSIVTIGDSYEIFRNLTYHCQDVRRRWLHFNNDDSEIGVSAYQSANNYILSIDYSLISFFTPIYKTGEKLWRTYESLRRQTHRNWEWVLVNDSDDYITSKIADSISKLDCRVKLYDFKKKSNNIIGESKYRAAALSKGKYIVELDHDDYILPEAAELVIKAFQQYPDVKFVYSDCAEIDEYHNSLTYGEGFAFGYGSYTEEIFNNIVYKVAKTPNINPITIRHIVGVPNHLRAWDRIFYHSINGHNRRLPIADDYELIVRSFLKTKFVCIRKLLYLQFYHNSNTQNSTRKDIQRRVRSISNFYNKQINDRFEELGVEDYAYMSNPQNPLLTEPRYGDNEKFVNYIMY